MDEKKCSGSSGTLSFDIAKTVAYWSEGAEYDLETANTLLKSKRYPYALFFGHLALEKILKAHVVKSLKMHAPYTHSLPLLAQRSGLAIPADYVDRFSEFMMFHIEARYPEANRAFYEKCNESYAKARMREIEEVFAWLKRQL